MGWDSAAHPRASSGTSTGGQFIAYDSSKKTGTGYGKKGGDSRVKRLQKALNALGFTDMKKRGLEVDGQLGPLTTSSVRKAQAKLGLKQDGRVTAALLNRLEAQAAAKKKSGTASKAADARIRQMVAKKTGKTTSKTTATTPAKKPTVAQQRKAQSPKSGQNTTPVKPPPKPARTPTSKRK